MYWYSFAPSITDPTMCQGVIEVSEAQWEFLQQLAAHGYNVHLTRKDFAITDEQLAIWKADPLFWPGIRAAYCMHARAARLTPEYLKDYALSSLEGIKKPTKVQVAVLNASLRLLGIGNDGMRGKVVVEPNHIEVSFNDGVQALPSPCQPQVPNQAPQTLPGPIPGPNMPQLEHGEKPNGQ